MGNMANTDLVFESLDKEPIHDVMGRGKDVYTEQPVALEHIQVWNGKGWLPVVGLHQV